MPENKPPLALKPLRVAAHAPEFQIGDRMRKARRSTGATMAEIADVLNVSRQTIHDWENGRRRPSKIAVFAYAAVTTSDFEWLWGEDEPPRSGDCHTPSLVSHSADESAKKPLSNGHLTSLNAQPRNVEFSPFDSRAVAA